MVYSYDVNINEGLFNSFFWYFKLSSKIFIEEVCVVALAPAMMTISGSRFYPLLVMLSISGWYFLVLQVMVSDENLSLQYVNSIN